MNILDWRRAKFFVTFEILNLFFLNNQITNKIITLIVHKCHNHYHFHVSHAKVNKFDNDQLTSL